MENKQVGPFQIIKKLGTTRRQRVYHARQVEQNRDVALKFISIPPEVPFAQAVVKIEIEVKELQKLDHPNLVKVFGAGVHDGEIFFASELIEGESLAAILSRRGKITPDLVVEYGRQLADLMKYLHQQELVHAKLTPEKILITPDHQVKLADLRLNRARRKRWDASRRRELDIAAYMAPEQFTEGATPKTDFYALGVILFEMITGKLPYPPETMARMLKNKLNAPVPSAAAHVLDCPIWLDKLISQMLQPNPRKRPHSAKAIVLAFDEIQRMDASRTAAVDQMAGTFNALNAGTDKSEAHRLLGKKKRREQPQESFFQSIPFMAGCLLLIIGFLVFMAIPASSKKIMTQGKELLASHSFDDWKEATLLFSKVMDRQDAYHDEAERLYYESRRKFLVRQAEQGITNKLQSDAVRQFGKAVRLQNDERYEEALPIFQSLVETVSPTGPERHVAWESQRRIDTIKKNPPLPHDPKALEALIDQTNEATTQSELQQAQARLSRIMLRFSGDPQFASVVQQAERHLKRVKKQLRQFDESGDHGS